MTRAYFHKTPKYQNYVDFFLAYRIYRKNEERFIYFMI